MEHSIQVANEKQIDWAIYQLRERYPAATIDEDQIHKIARKAQSYLRESVGIRFSLGGPDFFRGLCKAAFNLLGVANRTAAQHAALDKARYFILKGEGKSEDFVRWVPTPATLNLPHLGGNDHFVGIYSSGGTIGGVVQLYGDLPFVLSLGKGCDCKDFIVCYAVNPYRDTDPAESRELTFHPKNLPAFDSCAMFPDKYVWPYYIARIKRILDVYQKRADQGVISEIVQDALVGKEGQVITEEDIERISRRAAEYIAHRMARPNTPNKHM